MAQAGLASVADLCLGIQDVLGLTLDPLQEMRALGHAGLREGFARLQDEAGPRFDPGPLEETMARLAA